MNDSATDMENVRWKLEGMTCTNCALTIQKYLEKEGASNVKVNFIGGNLSFDVSKENDIQPEEFAKGIEELGYRVHSGNGNKVPAKTKGKKLFKNNLQRFLFCFVFTAPC